MGKNTQIADLINYISVNGSGDIVMTGNIIMPGGSPAATQSYVTTAISNLINAAPTALDTLAELSTALNNDASFASTVTNSIATKLALSGGTLTGALNGTTLSLVGTNNLGIKLKQGTQIGDLPSSTNFYNGAVFENSSTTNAWSIGYSQGAKFSINYFDGSSTYARYISITTAGAVGIGVLSPERILDIDATGSNAAIRIRKASSNMIFLGTGSSSISAGTENAILQMHHNADERIRLYTEGNSWINGGNVGINTSSPLERFSVNGNIHVAGVGNVLYFDTDASGRSISQYVTNLYEFHIFNGRGNSARFILGNGSISLGTSGTAQFYINTSSGNVGMGTTDFSNLAFGSTLLKVAGTRATLGLQSSGTLSTIALIASNNLSTALHLNFENTGAFRWYSYVSGSETFSLLGNGRLGLGVSSPDARLHVGGAILVSNNSQTYRRAITCHGQSGTYSQIKVYFNKSNWGSVTYDIKLASAGGTYHTAGCYYSNPGFSSNLVSINAGNGPSMSMTADSQTGSTQGALWVFSGTSMIHPILTIDISCGNGYQVNPDDIVVQFL